MDKKPEGNSRCTDVHLGAYALSLFQSLASFKVDRGGDELLVYWWFVEYRLFCDAVAVLNQRVRYTRSYTNFILFEYWWDFLGQWIDTCSSHPYVNDACKLARDRVPADDHDRCKRGKRGWKQLNCIDLQSNIPA